MSASMAFRLGKAAAQLERSKNAAFSARQSGEPEERSRQDGAHEAYERALDLIEGIIRAEDKP